MRTNKNTSKIILATTVALLAMLVSYFTFSNMGNQLTDQQKTIDELQRTKSIENSENFAYAISTKDLKAGEIVSDEDVDFQQFQTINPNAFENRSDVVNKVLLQDITSGTVFTSIHIAKISNDNVSLKPGYRALTLPADNFQGKSDKMGVGSLVDIYSAAADNNWVMEDVRIIGFESGSSSSSSSSSSSTATSSASAATKANVGMTNASAITFEVSASEISDFISNVSKNKLVLVARNASDRKVTHKKKRYVASGGYGGGGYHGSSMASMPSLPASVPISNFPGGKSSGGSGLSGLPQPIQPMAQTEAVEVIEANVKSKVTFD